MQSPHNHHHVERSNVNKHLTNNKDTHTNSLAHARARAPSHVQTISFGPLLFFFLLPFSLSSSVHHPLFFPPPTRHVTRKAPASKSRDVCVYVNTETLLDNNKDTHTTPQSHALHKLSLQTNKFPFVLLLFLNPTPPCLILCSPPLHFPPPTQLLARPAQTCEPQSVHHPLGAA